jgi:hypothetical protein
MYLLVTLKKSRTTINMFSVAMRPSPLSDITNMRVMQANKLVDVPTKPVASTIVRIRQHAPYSWKCLPDDEFQAAVILSQRRTTVTERPLVEVVAEKEEQSHAHGGDVCCVLVQFKCHQAEYSSTVGLEKGQYVVVQGDRGIDVGVVIRINTDVVKSYVERTGPCGNILRHATQREVDYWATDLKADEAAAVDLCQQRVLRLHLNMEVRQAEYQFDKKKLTFYYDAKSRVDFVQLLKELYREYGCRIWMEKVRSQE